jgi:hypothetical protein
MHDFIQSLSFQAQHSPALARTATEVLRSVMRSFGDEVPFTAYRPLPAVPSRARRPRAAARNRKS